MGLFSKKKLIKVRKTKKDTFSGWLKCTDCAELIHLNELEQNKNCCPKCDYHYRLGAIARINTLADEGSFCEMFDHIVSSDPLSFVDSKSYIKRLEEARHNSNINESVVVGSCVLCGHSIALGVLDFNFMGGSMGSAMGERLTLLIEFATHYMLPLVIVSSSGGARMQESALSLMQMAKTSAAIAKHSEQKLPYISVLANPTTGGVTASFATLGDIIIAEPNALIGFAGPRVVEQTIRQKLPPGAQRSEFALEHGLIDCIVKRQDLKSKISQFIDFLSPDTKKYTLDEIGKKLRRLGSHEQKS